jgi:DNA polymerase III alpha subunit
MTEERAKQIAYDVWEVIENSSRYSFNASHAISTAYDSLYGAFQKTMMTYEFYQVVLATYSGEYKKEKRDIAKLAKIKAELPNFGIALGGLKWGNDNSTWVIDKEAKTIYQSLLSVKGLNQEVANYLSMHKNSKFSSFVDLFLELKQDKVLNATHWKNLARIDYFSDFAKRRRVVQFLSTYEVFDKTQMRKSSMEKAFTQVGLKQADYIDLIKRFCGSESDKQYNKIDKVGLLKAYWDSIPNEELPPAMIIRDEFKLLEDVVTRLPVVFGKVTGVSHKTRSIRFYSMRTHAEGWFSVDSTDALPHKDDVIIVSEITQKRRGNKTGLHIKGIRTINMD